MTQELEEIKQKIINLPASSVQKKLKTKNLENLFTMLKTSDLEDRLWKALSKQYNLDISNSYNKRSNPTAP